MLKLAADENFDNNIIRGLLLRESQLDIKRIQDVGLRGADDPLVLAWAEEEGRVLLTHDVSTMSAHAYERIESGLSMPGIFLVSSEMPIGDAIEEILLLAGASLPNEWENQVQYIPLR
jgi:hypothetical protein